MDSEIFKLENELPQSVVSARIAKTITTRDGISIDLYRSSFKFSIPRLQAAGVLRHGHHHGQRDVHGQRDLGQERDGLHLRGLGDPGRQHGIRLGLLRAVAGGRPARVS